MRQHLVSKPHEVFFFTPLEVVSLSTQLGRKQVSWLVRLTDWYPLQLTTNCSQLNFLQ